MRPIGLLMVAAAVLLTTASCSTSNVAQDRLDAVLSAFGLDAVHGKELCDRGDGGHGLDNDSPWYTVHFQVDGTDDLDTRVRAVYQAAGYRPTQLPNPPDRTDPYGYYPDDTLAPAPTTTAYRALQGGRQFDAMITRDGIDQADCLGGPSYPRPLPASHARPVVMFSLSLPGQDR
jgi:hypothetical protein